MQDKIDAWWCHKLRCKPAKAVVKLYRSGTEFLDAINIPSVTWPLNGSYEVFHFNNCELIEDAKIAEIVDAIPYHYGHCYSNAEAVTKDLCDAGYEAKTYVGWLFLARNLYPIHHAWTVVNGIHVIDLADDFALQAYNEEQFEADSDNERRLRRLGFIKWAQQFPHSERCTPFGTPAPDLLYIGCECSREDGVQIYNNLIYTYPNHPCAEKVQEDGMTKMQQLMAQEGLM